jgi:pyrroline-5-carboxylate reductase
MSKYELGVIGGGNMAEAILRGVLKSGYLKPAQVVVSEPNAARAEWLAAQLGIACVTDNLIPAGCGKVLLAAKPQVMADVLERLAPAIGAQTLVISIAAGKTCAFLDAALGGRGRLVRVMPNTPMLAGCGMSALCAGPRAGKDDLAWAEGLFAASGKTCFVEENLIDAVVAVSGSGPAYFFYLIEAMVEAGIAEGLDRPAALLLATQTCQGSARLLEESQSAPEVLRAKVTSPNGTTQRAIETLDAAGVKQAMVKAFRACAERSRELGR